MNPITRYRQQHNLSQRQFAQQLGWSTSTVHRYETGQRYPQSSHARQLIALGISLDALLGGGNQTQTWRAEPL